jgi:SAM-dependent methyltransferase
MIEIQNNHSEEVTRSSTTIFADYAHYYDLLYRDKDYAAEAEYVVSLIRKFHPSARSILEFGSGTGIHASLLADKGFTLHGIERSPEMLTISKALTENRTTGDGRLTFSAGDIRESRLNNYFDTVIALFHVISYQTTNEDVTAAFETARQHLNLGGVFIFDVWYGPAVLTERPAVRIKRMANNQTEITRLAEPVLHLDENLVDVNYHMFVRNLNSTQSVTELKETHTMRYFFKPEIELIATQSGFQCNHAEEWLSGKAIGCKTWSVCFVLKKIITM